LLEIITADNCCNSAATNSRNFWLQLIAAKGFPVIFCNLLLQLNPATSSCNFLSLQLSAATKFLNLLLLEYKTEKCIEQKVVVDASWNFETWKETSIKRKRHKNDMNISMSRLPEVKKGKKVTNTSLYHDLCNDLIYRQRLRCSADRWAALYKHKSWWHVLSENEIDYKRSSSHFRRLRSLKF